MNESSRNVPKSSKIEAYGTLFLITVKSPESKKLINDLIKVKFSLMILLRTTICLSDPIGRVLVLFKSRRCHSPARWVFYPKKPFMSALPNAASWV